MFLYENLEKNITSQLRTQEQAKALEHKPSGKLSASMLGEPAQWQILKTLGIGTRQIDDYTLRKFAVGNIAEKWYLDACGGQILERQRFIQYKEAIGYADAMVNAEIATENGTKVHTIPLEVKSCSNAKFKYILKRVDADENHKLQAAFYALGVGADYFGISYVATDDYRSHTWIFSTADYQERIDSIIANYQYFLGIQAVPIFTPTYEWQAKPEYNKFPEWSTLTANEIKMALDYHHPNAWENYKNGQKAKT